MNIICIDTSSASIAITAKGPSGVFTSVFTPVKTGHSSFVIPAIETAISTAGFTINETEILICPQGPGGFTGLRLAYSTAKAIQLKTNAEFYCVPILEALYSKYGDDGQFLSIIDAKRDCFYVQAFDNKKAVSEALDISAEKAINLINTNKKTLVCGFGINKFKKDSEKLLPSDKFTFILANPDNTSKLIFDYFICNKNLMKVNEYDGPIYIRKTDAEQT